MELSGKKSTLVVAAIMVEEGKVFIARRRKEKKLGGLWEFPGGKVEEGESPESGLRRELAEELGIDVTVGRYVGEAQCQYPHGAVQLKAYEVVWQKGCISLTDHDTFQWAPIKGLGDFEFTLADRPFVDLLMKGEISGGTLPAGKRC